MRTSEPNKPDDSFNVEVDYAKFLEVGRVFKRFYKPRAANVILTLRNGQLRIEFFNGGCELPCDHVHNLTAELSAKSFASIISAHRDEKTPNGKITLTFRPEFGEFATALAGAKAEFHTQKSLFCFPSSE